MKNKGFTLIEIMVSIIIVAILAAIGLVNYMGQLEKSRSAEAQANLGMLKTLARSYYQETGNYPVLSDLMDATNILPSAGSVNCTNANYYFDYKCDGDQDSPTCTATRCTSGGRPPNHTDWGAASYYYSINWLTGSINCVDSGDGRCPK